MPHSCKRAALSKWVSAVTQLTIACVVCAIAIPAYAANELRTLAEQTDFKRTGRYEEVQKLCNAYQQTWPKQVRCFEFGRTPEGRPMMALAASADGALTATAAHEKSRPVVLMQGGIHAGEIDGKDAGFWALRDVLEGRAAKDALQRATFVFVPVFNVDGHERFGRNNRPNQVGPEEMGWRTTGQNFNLNRDYVKAEAPEMQAMLRLLNEWDPILYVDLHVTNGANFEHDIALVVEPTLSGDAELKRHALAMREAALQRLSRNGSLPLGFYPTLRRSDDPTSGFADSVYPPRFSHRYWSLRNRMGVLVETHSWKDYKTRVRATYHTVIGLLEQTAASGRQWVAAAKAAEQRAAQLGGADFALAYANTESARVIDFRGYRYTRMPSPISGALMTKYDSATPQIWRVPFHYEVRPSITAVAPRGGYVVAPAHADSVAEKLNLHGVRFIKLERGLDSLDLETFRADRVAIAPATNEGRATLSVDGAWRSEQRSVPSGSLFVPIAQPNAPLAITLFEPHSADSLLAWGYFNAAFERKEYMDAYVAEQVALEMMATDQALKAEFERLLREDAAFAQDPRDRLDFFYRRHPSWDERFNLYPVYRSQTSLSSTP
jgi:hypothetical protein